MTRRTGRLLVLAAALLLAGCAEPTSYGTNETVACRVGDDAEPADGLVLMAQSVPTARWVPCLQGTPVGWSLDELRAERDSARFWLSSDRHGPRALEVALTATCDTTEATEIPSEREGLRRFEQVRLLSPLYIGTRYYVFDGGCISLSFRVPGTDRAEPLSVATQGLGVLSRDDLAAHVREESGGRLELDPAELADGDR